MKFLLKKKILHLILVMALLLSFVPASALAAESYTDVNLSFYDASNGFVFTADNGKTLLNTYGAWKTLRLTVQRQGSSQSAEGAFTAPLEEINARINLDESGKIHIYDASESAGLKLVIPAGTVVTPDATAVTTPFSSTVATEGSMEVQVISGFISAGWMKVSRATVSPTDRVSMVLIMLTFCKLSGPAG
jgi:hypothetical protein